MNRNATSWWMSGLFVLALIGVGIVRAAEEAPDKAKAAPEQAIAAEVAEKSEDAEPGRVYGEYAKLNLSPEQKTQVSAIQATYREKIKALETEESAKVHALLNDEQKAQLTKLQEERQARNREYAKEYREKQKAEEAAAKAAEKAKAGGAQ